MKLCVRRNNRQFKESFRLVGRKNLVSSQCVSVIKETHRELWESRSRQSVVEGCVRTETKETTKKFGPQHRAGGRRQLRSREGGVQIYTIYKMLYEKGNGLVDRQGCEG